MNIGMALNKAEGILENACSMTPALDAGVILCFVLGCDRAYLLSHYEQELDSHDENKFFELVTKRAAGTPIQHITGYKEFMSLNFRVNSHVLIPRPETEILVEAVLEHVKARICAPGKYERCIYATGKHKQGICASGKHKQGIYPTGKHKQRIYVPGKHEQVLELEILDLGTGSGCIAVSLAHYIAPYIDNYCVTASDVSAEALDLAHLNALANGVSEKINFVLSDLFEKLQNITFDIIVSNPPYIPSREIGNLQVEVKKHEPIIALDGGEDGLYYYREIIGKSPCHLKGNGLLVLEAGYGQACHIAQMMKVQGFEGIRIVKDLAGIDRVVMGTWAS